VEKTMADDKPTKPSGEPTKIKIENERGAQKAGDTAPNKAQAEFEKYMKRMQAQGGVPGFMMPGGEGMPGWAVPPSVAMFPRGGPGYFAPIAPAGEMGTGSLTASLGSTLRLGVDVLNAALAGGVRFLNGVSDAAYGEREHCDCGGCNDDPCGSDCCDCECCHPSVGNCC
jgi:hypothetical protein